MAASVVHDSAPALGHARVRQQAGEAGVAIAACGAVRHGMKISSLAPTGAGASVRQGGVQLGASAPGGKELGGLQGWRTQCSLLRRQVPV